MAVRPYVPRYPGKSFAVRLINRLRYALPRLTYLLEAIGCVRVSERSGLVWKAVLRVPVEHRSGLITVSDLKSALPRLLALKGPGYVSFAGWTYEVVPSCGSFVQGDNNLSHREYSTYEDYVRHQASKLDEGEVSIRRMSEQRYRKMTARFGEVVTAAGLSGRVLCLGARLGEEVRAFRQVGLDAIGVDLNPGANNSDCLSADFHHLPFTDDVFDGAYSNVLDHVYDMDRFMREAVRIVRPGGFIFFELSGGYSETGVVDPYGATRWQTNAVLVNALSPYIDEVVFDRTGPSPTLRVIVFRPSKVVRTGDDGARVIENHN